MLLGEDLVFGCRWEGAVLEAIWGEWAVHACVAACPGSAAISQAFRRLAAHRQDDLRRARCVQYKRAERAERIYGHVRGCCQEQAVVRLTRHGISVVGADRLGCANAHAVGVTR